jgi:hypothetical protein
MSMISKVLIGLAGVAFLLAVFVSLFWPIAHIPAESFSRASTNLALIAIALSIAFKDGSTGG